MQAHSRAFFISKAGLLPAFDRLREYCFLALLCICNAIPSMTFADQELSFPDLEKLVETCIQQTDLNIENQSALPDVAGNPKFSEVRIEDADEFEEATKLRIAKVPVEWVFRSDKSENSRQKNLIAIQDILQLDRARQNHRKRVLRQIYAHSLWKNPAPGDSERNNFGIIGGSAWWYSEDVAVVWAGTSSLRNSSECRIYDVPPSAARNLVENSKWSFEQESYGPISRYVATQNAIAPGPRLLIGLVTGIGKKHSLPSARIKVFEIGPGFLNEDSSDEWFIVISDSRYDLL